MRFLQEALPHIATEACCKGSLRRAYLSGALADICADGFLKGELFSHMLLISLYMAKEGSRHGQDTNEKRLFSVCLAPWRAPVRWRFARNHEHTGLCVRVASAHFTLLPVVIQAERHHVHNGDSERVFSS
jgi:hypothetical protein